MVYYFAFCASICILGLLILSLSLLFFSPDRKVCLRRNQVSREGRERPQPYISNIWEARVVQYLLN